MIISLNFYCLFPRKTAFNQIP